MYTGIRVAASTSINCCLYSKKYTPDDTGITECIVYTLHCQPYTWVCMHSISMTTRVTCCYRWPHVPAHWRIKASSKHSHGVASAGARAVPQGQCDAAAPAASLQCRRDCANAVGPYRALADGRHHLVHIRWRSYRVSDSRTNRLACCYLFKSAVPWVLCATTNGSFVCEMLHLH